MNFVGMEPRFYGSSSILLLWGDSVIWHGNIHEIFAQKNRKYNKDMLLCITHEWTLFEWQ